MTDARHAPATMRNRQPLAEVFRRVLPAKARVLEVASGTGEHAVYFASELDVIWQPSDADPDALRSIEAHRLAWRLCTTDAAEEEESGELAVCGAV